MTEPTSRPQWTGPWELMWILEGELHGMNTVKRRWFRQYWDHSHPRWKIGPVVG